MAYTKTVWENSVTWIDAHKMNNIENGIEEIDQTNSDNTAKLEDLQTQLTSLQEQESNNEELLSKLQDTINTMQATTTAIANLVGV